MKVFITAPIAHRFDPKSREKFIEFVNSVDSLLKEFKLMTYITYRDFLRWGKVLYNSNTVFEKLNLELKTSDLVLSLHPNDGIGSNIVLGMAGAMKKNLIIVLDKSFDMNTLPGLMYKGLQQMTKCEIIAYSDWNDLEKKLRSTIRKFLKHKK